MEARKKKNIHNDVKFDEEKPSVCSKTDLLHGLSKTIIRAPYTSKQMHENFLRKASLFCSPFQIVDKKELLLWN